MRMASSTGEHVRSIREKRNLLVSVRLFQGILNQFAFLNFRKADIQHGIKQNHRERRVERAEEHVTWSEEKLCDSIYSDEKNLTWKGPITLTSS